MHPDPHALLKAKLRRAKLRLTSPRLAVFAALEDAGPHQDAEQIALIARKRLGSLSTQAVYDNLRVLADAGLVRRIEIAGKSSARYEMRVGDNHHHLVCRDCGVVHDIDCALGHAPCLEPAKNHGFQIDEAEVTYWGVCPDCRKA